ncbi:MAG: serine/threonine protein kinase [Planctomycetota bacterium]|nr:serine/threonine protein kinase [Planctomycetota bacterium]
MPSPPETEGSPRFIAPEPDLDLAHPDEPPTLGPGGLSRSSPSSDEDLGMRFSPDLEFGASRLSARTTAIWPDPSASRAAAGRAVMGPDSPAAFGNYELLREVGRGGMGVVYKARQRGLDRLVAIKMILASHLANADQVERFYAEARAAAKLQDPHVVAIHDVGEIQGQHYFAMEFIDGPSLAQKLNAGPIDPRDAAKLVAIVARAVDRLHARGIVHRDLKPSNILLDTTGRPFVTDFGLAKMFSGDRPETYSNAIVGTPSYMAPEQAAGRKTEVGPLSDVYSLGAILYELLTGRPPFEERNPLDTLVQVLESEPTPPSRIRQGLPKTLEWICLKCLEKSPGERYASAEALAKDLERFLTGEIVEARKLGVWPLLRRWSRREPSLVTRLSAMAICVSVLQLDQFFRENFDRSVNRRVLIVLGLGTLTSLSFQGLLKRERWSTLARYAWATADVALFTTLVLLIEGLQTSIVAGFFLLVAASGLWFRERLVVYTTALAVISYGLLVGEETTRLPALRLQNLHLHVLFMALLSVSGLIVAYQVKRVRALSQYYEHRPLP